MPSVASPLFDVSDTKECGGRIEMWRIRDFYRSHTLHEGFMHFQCIMVTSSGSEMMGRMLCKRNTGR